MKRLLFGLVFVAIGVFAVHYFSNAEKDAEDELTLKINKSYDEQVLDNSIRNAVNKAKSIGDLEKAELDMQGLPKQYQERIAPNIALRKAAIWFNEAEECLRRAIEIENAAVVPPGPPPMPMADPENPDEPEPIPAPQPQRELHPLTVDSLNRAFALYEKARKESEKLKDGDDLDFNYHMNYLKGEIYYRVLEFLAEPDTAQELFNQALTYYKYALRNRNNDINTVVNIELMIKNQNSLLGNAAGPQARKKQMLTSKKFGIGKSSGN